MRLIGAILAVAPALAVAAVVVERQETIAVFGDPINGPTDIGSPLASVTDTATAYDADIITVIGDPINGATDIGSPTVSVTDTQTAQTTSIDYLSVVYSQNNTPTATVSDGYTITAPVGGTAACQITASASESDKVWVSGTAYTSLTVISGTLHATEVPWVTATTTGANGEATTVLNAQALAASSPNGAMSNINSPVGLGGAAIVGAGLLAAML